MTPYVYFNGSFVPEAEATVRIDDGGWLHGAGLFETMRAEHGRVFRYQAHIARLCRSAAKLLAPLAPEALPGAAAFQELLDRNGLTEARVRLTVSAGPMRSNGNQDRPEFTVCATAVPLVAHPSRLYEQGVRAVVCDFRISPTDPTAGHKTTGYLPRLLGLRAAHQARCFEALWFTTANRLAEGSISNIFLVHNGVLKTPPLDTPVLPGIARGIVGEIAEMCDIELSQVPLTINDLLDADEAMLTNAMVQVMPLVGVEKRIIGDGRVGPVTKRLLEAYRERVRRECCEP